MERDFMSLLPKSLPVTVKQEADDGSNYPATMRGSGSQWSSQFLSFKTAQQQGASHKLYSSGFSQGNLPLDKQGGSHYPMTRHYLQHNDAQSVNHPHEVRLFPTASQTNQIAASISSPVHLSHLAPNGLNVVGSTIGGSIPPPNCPVVGSTDLRNSSSVSTGPGQLTIFYNGSVCVYDHVSPEKAQAIMLLAGNGESKNFSAPPALPSAPKLQPPVLRSPANSSPIPNHSLGFASSISLPPPVSSLAAVASSCPAEVIPVKLQPPVLRSPANSSPIPNHSLGFSSSISVPPPVSSLSAVASSCPAEVNPVKPVVSPAYVKCPVPSKSPVGTGGVNCIPSAVPQARKASLARFLEKRKERVIGAYPYVVSKTTTECITAQPGVMTFATNSASSTPLPANN